MRVAGNKIKHLQAFYFSELNSRYDEGEIRALFRAVLQHFLNFTATDVLLKSEENVNQSDLLKIYDTAKFLKEGRPLQYILKEAWFLNQAYYVDEAVLIPRPETEELVDLIFQKNKQVNALLDIGTGSGCIPISIQRQYPHAHVFGCDVSEAALAVAKRNAQKRNAPVQFLLADALSLDFTNQFSEAFDVIVSNPPYIKKSEAVSMAEHVLSYEPHLALFVNGEDAILFYRAIIRSCEQLLMKGGTLYFELNPFTANEVKHFAEESGLFESVELIQDLSGKNRFLRAERSRS